MNDQQFRNESMELFQYGNGNNSRNKNSALMQACISVWKWRYLNRNLFVVCPLKRIVLKWCFSLNTKITEFLKWVSSVKTTIEAHFFHSCACYVIYKTTERSIESYKQKIARNIIRQKMKSLSMNQKRIALIHCNLFRIWFISHIDHHYLICKAFNWVVLIPDL